jgi:hypothetical protein
MAVALAVVAAIAAVSAYVLPGLPVVGVLE